MSNGLNALAVLGADEVVRRIGMPTTAMVIQSWTGKRLAEFGTLPGLPDTQFVWRAELYRALYEEAAGRAIPTEHGKRLVGAEKSGDGVTAQFADGTEASADILIGADGIRSTARSLIDPAAPQPGYAGLLSFGARTSDTGLLWLYFARFDERVFDWAPAGGLSERRRSFAFGYGHLIVFPALAAAGVGVQLAIEASVGRHNGVMRPWCWPSRWPAISSDCRSSNGPHREASRSRCSSAGGVLASAALALAGLGGALSVLMLVGLAAAAVLAETVLEGVIEPTARMPPPRGVGSSLGGSHP